MFHLYQSNKVETLFAQLVRLLLEQDASPLQTQTVVVENPGLAHWLKMQLANSLGIAANIEFPMPSRFFWQTQRTVLPGLAQESVYQKDNLRWLIFTCLQDQQLLSQPEFHLLRHYLAQGEDNASAKSVRQYRLAITIADLYDQYLVYRPDWINNWEHEKYELDAEPLADQKWQGLLWFELRRLIAAKNLPLAHRANMLDDFLEHLQQGHTNLPQQVIFFGFTTLPKHQLDSLSVLSQHMEVHLLTPNPCEHYWGDVLDNTTQAKLRLKGKSLLLAEAGNDLLASLGRMGQDYQRLLLDVPHIQEQSLFHHAPGDDLLSSIQGHILHLQGGTDAPQAIIAGDTSLQVVGCHSPMREVEVLHDHLLSLLDKDPQLKPQDIVVMIPDVAAYAPFIDAVFNSQVSQRFIAYSISDRPLQAEHPLLNAFLLLLQMPSSRMGLSEVLALLEMPAIYKRYGLKESQLKPLSRWLVEAGVRWGFNEQHRAQQDLPGWQENSWLYGFRRLLMGYGVNAQAPVLGIVPVANVEGLEAVLLGPLMKFVNDLHQFGEACRRARSGPQWGLFINDMLANFFTVDAAEQAILEHVHLALEHWSGNLQFVDYQAPIEYEVLVDGLQQGLQKSGGSQHFMVGKVNFCTLLPMRSIPFKVVAILGLNDQDYPRSVTPSSLDLMHTRRRLGDRSRRDEDRYLFLEAMLSARQSLWLSYRSKSQQNDEPLTPSVVLAELLDYIQANFCAAPADSPSLFTQHPLQAFNQQYFSQHSPLFSYNQNWLAVHGPRSAEGVQPLAVQEPLEPTAERELLLEDLVQFYLHPAKYYLNKMLKVNLFFDSEVDDDDEPFALDFLQQYQVKQRAIQHFLEAGLVADEEHHFTEGLNAYGEIGERQWSQLKATLAPVLQSCQQYMQDKIQQPQEINLHFAPLNVQLMGWQKEIYAHNLVKVVPSKLKAKSIVPALIEHAALCAMDATAVARGALCVVICQDYLLTLKAMKQSEAKRYLQTLLEHFQQGQITPLAMLPQTAWQLQNPLHLKEKKGECIDKRQSEAEKTFYGLSGPYGQPGEREDLNIRRCFNQLDDIPAATQGLAKVIYAPWLAQQLMTVSSL